ncbi:hypothetical protein [Parendozoicomonas sp. Alg238-R29]|uniref:hypothetical protein n=1 Tax=Parendozoicomonas sp. Alg238-R29 TaxID=2993446 RepID=UPI00248E3B6D|nr:hypothetical protein [Parendozoicomonas sp. Alg238-R29]
MSKVHAIKKKAHDGWVITELHDEKSNSKNIYTLEDKVAPQIYLTDAISKKYAAYTLIEKDLRNVIAWLEEIEKIKPRFEDNVQDRSKMLVVKSLFVSAITFYAKCFTSCEGRKIKLDKATISKEFIDTHNQAMKLRHNYTAHSGAENFEEVKISLVLHPHIQSLEYCNIFTELKQPFFMPDENFKFMELVKWLQEKVWEKRTSIGELVLEKSVKSKGPRFWYEKSTS